MFTSLIFVKEVNRRKLRGHKGVPLRIPGGLFRPGFYPGSEKGTVRTELDASCHISRHEAGLQSFF